MLGAAVVAVCGVSFGPFIVAGQLPQVLLPFNPLSTPFQLPFSCLSAPFCFSLAPFSLLPAACIRQVKAWYYESKRIQLIHLHTQSAFSLVGFYSFKWLQYLTGNCPLEGLLLCLSGSHFVGECVQLCRQVVPIGVVLPALRNSS